MTDMVAIDKCGVGHKHGDVVHQFQGGGLFRSKLDYLISTYNIFKMINLLVQCWMTTLLTIYELTKKIGVKK